MQDNDLQGQKNNICTQGVKMKAILSKAQLEPTLTSFN